MFIRKLFFGNSNSRTKEIEETSSKWQNKLHLAQINPEPNLDLTDCGLKCLPKGIYSQCRIFHKNRLLLNDNCLSTLPDDVDNYLVDLIDLCTFLNLSRNQLNCLPPNLGKLVNLKELYLTHNMIKCVPQSFVHMKSLETIDISHNQLNQFPSVFCEMVNLKHIDISYNQLITQLPFTICNLIKLEKLLIIGTNIKHPPKRVCDQGIESLTKFFKSEQLANYKVKPMETNYVPDQVITESKPSTEDNLKSYLAKKDDRKKRLIEFEKNLLCENKSMEISNRKMIDKRQETLMKMKKDQLMLHKGLESLFAKKVEDKSSIVKALALIEEHSSQLVEQLKNLQPRIKHSTGDHEDTDEFTIINHDQSFDSLEEKLRQFMISKDLTKESLQSELIKEDENLISAIRNFVNMKNTQTLILSEQIRLIEHELYHLTRAEIQRQKNNLDQQTTNINGQRVALASLLKDLFDERNSKINQRENDSSLLPNFIERLTSSMINNQSNECSDKETENLDPHLNQLLDELESSLSQLYLPLLTDTSMSIQQLADSTNDQLKSLGIKEEHIPIIRKHIDICLPTKQSSPPSTSSVDHKPSAPPMKLYQLIECVICLDEQSKIILIPCGHVCTCEDCSKSLELCPLCRSEISEKIQSIQLN